LMAPEWEVEVSWLWLVKQKRALLESNPPRNSQPETRRKR